MLNLQYIYLNYHNSFSPSLHYNTVSTLLGPMSLFTDTHLIPEEIPLPSTQIVQAYTSIQECAYNLSGWKNKV